MSCSFSDRLAGSQEAAALLSVTAPSDADAPAYSQVAWPGGMALSSPAVRGGHVLLVYSGVQIMNNSIGRLVIN